MNMDFRKKSCAAEALKYIENDTTIGLGGGSTVSYLIGNIKEADLRVKVVTPPSLQLHSVSKMDCRLYPLGPLTE